jgi:hypothetical protein
MYQPEKKNVWLLLLLLLRPLRVDGLRKSSNQCALLFGGLPHLLESASCLILPVQQHMNGVRIELDVPCQRVAFPMSNSSYFSSIVFCLVGKFHCSTWRWRLCIVGCM